MHSDTVEIDGCDRDGVALEIGTKVIEFGLGLLEELASTKEENANSELDDVVSRCSQFGCTHLGGTPGTYMRAGIEVDCSTTPPVRGIVKPKKVARGATYLPC